MQRGDLQEPSPPRLTEASYGQGCTPGWGGRRGLDAYMHQLLLGVVFLGAVFPMAVGLIDDHLGLLLTVVPVQVFLEVSQLLLGGQRIPMGARSGHLAPKKGHY